MNPQQYRINRSAIAASLEADHQSAMVIPELAIVIVEAETLNKGQFIEVFWAEKRVLMLANDIRAKGEKI